MVKVMFKLENRILAIGLILLTIILGCSSSPYKRAQTPGRRYAELEAELLFDEAMLSYNENRLNVAIQGFQQLVRNYPNSWKKAEAIYYLAKSYNRLQNYEQTINWGNRLIEEHAKSDFVDETYFLLGETYKKIYDYYRGARSFLKVVDHTEDKDLRNEAENNFRSIISRNLSIEELIKLGENNSASDMIPLVYVVAAQKYLEENKNDRAKDLLEYAVTTFPINPYTQEAEYLYDKIWSSGEDYDSDYTEQKFDQPDYPIPDIEPSKTTGVDPNKIGLLVPQTGKYAVYGKSVKKGVELALQEYNSGASQPLSLVVVDSEGEPVQAVKGVRNLVDNEGVLAVIGPIMSGPAISVSSFVDVRKTPLITPTATERGISSISSYIFQLNFSTSESYYQGENMAEYAYERLGYRTFGLIYPTDRYSMGLASAFSNKIKMLGGEIVADEQYLEGNTDFKVQMKALKDADPEAIYVPANEQDILMLAPQFKYYDIDAQILGADGWDSERVVRQGEYYVEGVIFTSIFHEKNKFTNPNSFTKRYKYKHGAEADITAILAYDAMQIIIDGIQNGAITRQELRDSIANTKSYDGASGRITIQPDGSVTRKTFFLTITDGNIIELGD